MLHHLRAPTCSSALLLLTPPLHYSVCAPHLFLSLSLFPRLRHSFSFPFTILPRVLRSGRRFTHPKSRFFFPVPCPRLRLILTLSSRGVALSSLNLPFAFPFSPSCSARYLPSLRRYPFISCPQPSSLSFSFLFLRPSSAVSANGPLIFLALPPLRDLRSYPLFIDSVVSFAQPAHTWLIHVRPPLSQPVDTPSSFICTPSHFSVRRFRPLLFFLAVALIALRATYAVEW